MTYRNIFTDRDVTLIERVSTKHGRMVRYARSPVTYEKSHRMVTETVFTKPESTFDQTYKLVKEV
jgi:hypothetical protein